MRPRTEARFPTSLWAAGGKWEICGTYYSADRWSELNMFPDSVGRNGGEFAAAADADGNAWVALNTDQKPWGGPDFGEPPGDNDIMVAKLERESAAPAAGAGRSSARASRRTAQRAARKNRNRRPAQLRRRSQWEKIQNLSRRSAPAYRNLARWRGRRHAVGRLSLRLGCRRSRFGSPSPIINPAISPTRGGASRNPRICSMSPDSSPPSMAPSAA